MCIRDSDNYLITRIVYKYSYRPTAEYINNVTDLAVFAQLTGVPTHRQTNPATTLSQTSAAIGRIGSMHAMRPKTGKNKLEGVGKPGREWLWGSIFKTS